MRNIPCGLGLDVGDALGSGLRKMFFVPRDAAVDRIDVVRDFGESVSFARIANEDGFRAHIFQRDEKLLSFRNGHIIVVFAVQEHRGRVGGGNVLESGAFPRHVH